jgi:hypothetical protein
MSSTSVEVATGSSVAFAGLFGFRGVVTTAGDLARLGAELTACDTLAPELADVVLGGNQSHLSAVGTRPSGARWSAKFVGPHLGRTWREFEWSAPQLRPGYETGWFREPETARFAVLASEGWAVAALAPPGETPPGALAAIVRAATSALEPWLPPKSGWSDFIGVGGGAGGSYGGRMSNSVGSDLDDTKLVGQHRLSELGIDLTIDRVPAAGPRRYEVRLGAREPIAGTLQRRNESLILVATSASQRLTLHVALEGNIARLESLDLERGFTKYGPLLALAIDAGGD